jgi:hypothetical protein
LKAIGHTKHRHEGVRVRVNRMGKMVTPHFVRPVKSGMKGREGEGAKERKGGRTKGSKKGN